MYGIRRYVNLKSVAKLEQYGRLATIGQSSTLGDLKRTFYTYSPEPGQPINRDPTFCSIEEAVKCVKSGKLCVNFRRISFFRRKTPIGCQNVTNFEMNSGKKIVSIFIMQME